jgi:hypothetical protein
MAILAQTMGDTDRAKRLYREAAEADRHCNAPLFNLALMARDLGEIAEAWETIDQVLTRRASGPDFILAADLAMRQKREQDFRDLLDRGLARMGPTRNARRLRAWLAELRARLAHDNEFQRAAEEERSRRARVRSVGAKSELPIQTLGSAA